MPPKKGRQRCFSSTSRKKFGRRTTQSDNLRGRPGSPEKSQQKDTELQQQTVIRRSGLAGAGDGLFATAPFAANTTIGWYQGTTMKFEDTIESRSDSILRLQHKPWWIPKPDWDNAYTYVDAAGHHQLLRYINSSRDETEPHNVRMRDNGEFRTTVAVPVNGELLMDYGHGISDCDTASEDDVDAAVLTTTTTTTTARTVRARRRRTSPRGPVLFTSSELQQLRDLIQTVADGQRGVLDKQHRVLDQVRDRLEQRMGLTLLPETFLVRLFPGVHDDVAADHVLQHLQDPNTCLHCGRSNGLHWRRSCRDTTSIVTIVVNVGPAPGSIVSLGPECRVGRNASGGIVPVVSAQCLPVELQPGEALQFSPWTMNEVSPSSLDGHSISLHAFAVVRGPPRPAVFFPYFPCSENHSRLLHIYAGLKQWDIASTRIVPSHVPPAIQAAVRAIQPQAPVTAALVTSCMAAHHAHVYQVPVFAAVRPPGHQRTNTLVAAIYAARLLPTTGGRRLKRICIFDPDFHHGVGLQTILDTPAFKRYCRTNQMFILYFSVSRQRSDRYGETPTTVDSTRAGTQTIRLFSSGQGDTTTTDRLHRIQRVLLEVITPDFNLLVVAAGFDHCVGEKMEKRADFQSIPLWSGRQMVELGKCIRAAAEQTTAKHCVAILEGGYEESTLSSIVPGFLHAIGIPACPPPPGSSSSSSLSCADDADDTTESDDEVTQYVRSLYTAYNG